MTTNYNKVKTEGVEEGELRYRRAIDGSGVDEPYEFVKWLSTYTDNIKKAVEEDGVKRIHEIFNYPCSCERRQELCIHNFDLMHSVIKTLTK